MDGRRAQYSRSARSTRAELLCGRLVDGNELFMRALDRPYLTTQAAGALQDDNGKHPLSDVIDQTL